MPLPHFLVQFRGSYPGPAGPHRQAAGAGDGVQGDGARQGLHAGQEKGEQSSLRSSVLTSFFFSDFSSILWAGYWGRGA